MNAIERVRKIANGKAECFADHFADLRKLLALAESILAVNAHVDNPPDGSASDDDVSKWTTDLYEMEADVEEALAAVTEPTP